MKSDVQPPGEPLFLTGFMGTGKSSVGRELARVLDRRLVDTDEEVEREAGMSIAEIFRTEGESAFRQLERNTIERVLSERPLLVALGGGSFVDPKIRDLVCRSGRVVCLTARPERIAERVGDAADRPLLAGFPDRRRRIEELLKARDPAYREAEKTVDTSDRDPKAVAREIIAWLEGSGCASGRR